MQLCNSIALYCFTFTHTLITVKNKKIMETGNVLVGVLAGFAAGVTVGILFAPDKGSNTRRKISNKSNEFVNDLESKFNDLVETVNEKIDSVKDEVTHRTDNGIKKAETAYSSVK
jgi:gas vesicle protein